MAEQKRHLRVDRFRDQEDFSSKRRPRSAPVIRQQRAAHGGALLRQYNAALEQAEAKRQQVGEPLTEDVGIYLRLESVSDTPLPLESLDNRDFRLQSLHKEGDRELAVIFVPESRKQAFRKKLVAYLDASKDVNDKPKNQRLIDSIGSVHIADLRSFWTDAPEKYPQSADVPIWWEVWLSSRAQFDYLKLARAFTERVGATLGNSSLTFYGAAVVLVRATVTQLEQAIELISCLSELRKAKETPHVFVNMRNPEQRDWARDITARLSIANGVNTAAAILDTGVNFNHPVLRVACSDGSSVAWDDGWEKYHNGAARRDLEHASLQAGLVMLGDVQRFALSNENLSLNFIVESGRIIPTAVDNDPDLYGAITVGTARKLEELARDHRRVFSLAITAAHDGLSGQPSSWSSAIDDFAFPKGDASKLFVISTGNNRELAADQDYWDQALLTAVEDPGQAWNALTVGGYTELTTNDDPTYDGWSPLALGGDLSPASRTSVNWGWRRQAPYKPEVVAEGGNRLLSPARTETADASVVSLLTTSGRSAGPDFDWTSDTSASTALITRDATILTAENPNFWAETIRGLIVHSAEWTDRMFARKGLLERQHNQKVANEIMLRTFGYGVPNLDRARYSASNRLTLIAQASLQPFTRPDDAAGSDDATLNEMHLYALPWPERVLRDLGETEIKMRVTLSYFVEPNPGRRGYRQRYSYQSHGLRFEVIRPGQPLENFRALVNGAAVTEEYDGPQGDTDGWRLGPQLRARGCLHSDTWIGTAADLADMNVIAVYPVTGWWKSRVSEGRWNATAPYSLIVSIEAPEESTDLYTPVEVAVNVDVET